MVIPPNSRGITIGDLGSIVVLIILGLNFRFMCFPEAFYVYRNMIDTNTFINLISLIGLLECFLHDWDFKLPGGSSVKDEEDSLKRTVKETMEKAFSDSVMESMKLEAPDYSCISNLMREVRDERCQMVPDSWKVEITETIDLDLLSQLLNSGTLDIDYLEKMLEFALATLRKLSAPATDRENESTHQSLLEELHRLCDLCQAKDESGSLHAVAIVKGIRFILEQIHVCIHYSFISLSLHQH
ncbi:unnamed protein product [Brassica napus]|uniref:(rape) hypothetical protein n=1 Tax=Brassica napus TaxID=3708 RepID=A0A816K795_BRANA|nr:unnamed protein product [Brassica napus]